jgi:hypothetical protein
MQIEKAKLKINNAQPGRFTKRIGSTLYEVNVHFNEAAKETIEDKIFRLVSNEHLNQDSKYVTIKGLQTGRLPERGSA